jgi:hypothetical protein
MAHHWRSLLIIIAGDEAFFPMKSDFLQSCPGISARNDEGKNIFNYRAVENPFGILTRKVGYFMAQFILVLKPPHKLIFTAWVLRSCWRNDLSVDDFVAGNKDVTPHWDCVSISPFGRKRKWIRHECIVICGENATRNLLLEHKFHWRSEAEDMSILLIKIRRENLVWSYILGQPLGMKRN